MPSRDDSPKILLRGYYGFRNSGDDALLSAVIYGLRREFPEASFTVLCKTPIEIAEKQNVRFVVSSKTATTLEILKNDWLVFGGGGIFQDYLETSNLRKKLSMVRLAKLFGKKVLFIGVSIGPLTTAYGKEMTRKILDHADFISVRDPESYAWMKENGVRAPFMQTFDVAMLLKDLFRTKGEFAPYPSVGVSLLALSAHKEKDAAADRHLVDAMADGLNALMDDNPSLRVKIFVVHDGERDHFGDEGISGDLQRSLNDPSRVFLIRYSPDPSALFRGIASCTAFVGMRLHSNIFAFIARTPFLLVNYHSKCAGFAKAVGLPPSALISKEELLSGNPSFFKEKTEKLLKSPALLAPSKRPEDCCKDVSAHFQKIREHVQKSAA